MVYDTQNYWSSRLRLSSGILNIRKNFSNIGSFPSSGDGRFNRVTELSNSLHVKRRLRRQWPSDLIVEREEEE
jgi:hypothetical protein